MTTRRSGGAVSTLDSVYACLALLYGFIERVAPYTDDGGRPGSRPPLGRIELTQASQLRRQVLPLRLRLRERRLHRRVLSAQGRLLRRQADVHVVRLALEVIDGALLVVDARGQDAGARIGHAVHERVQPLAHAEAAVCARGVGEERLGVGEAVRQRRGQGGGVEREL